MNEPEGLEALYEEERFNATATHKKLTLSEREFWEQIQKTMGDQ